MAIGFPTESGLARLTGEAQQGLWFLGRSGHRHPGGLCRDHQDWAEALARAAEAT